VNLTAQRAALLLAVAASVSGAQIVRRPVVVSHPVNWAGVSIGITQGYTVNDGTTNASWSFGSGIEYAGRFEHPTSSGISLGAQASYANMPLSYSGAACSCNAHATVTQFLGVVHYGQGYAFHPIYELTAGAIGFGNFRNDATSTRFAGASTDYDFKIGLGYGLGFGLSPSAAIEVVQELGTVLHQRDNLSGSSSSYPRLLVTRLGGKISF
jgi:hypothetical protein